MTSVYQTGTTFRLQCTFEQGEWLRFNPDSQQTKFYPKQFFLYVILNGTM